MIVNNNGIGSSTAQNQDEKTVDPVTQTAANAMQRCFQCNKKITLAQTQMKCRCDHIFCSTHFLHSAHGCTFDYKAVSPKPITKSRSFHEHDGHGSAF